MEPARWAHLGVPNGGGNAVSVVAAASLAIIQVEDGATLSPGRRAAEVADVVAPPANAPFTGTGKTTSVKVPRRVSRARDGGGVNALGPGTLEAPILTAAIRGATYVAVTVAGFSVCAIGVSGSAIRRGSVPIGGVRWSASPPAWPGGPSPLGLKRIPGQLGTLRRMKGIRNSYGPTNKCVT